MSDQPSTFTISDESLRKRDRNLLWGAVFSLLLAAVIVAGHYRYPETYNDVLLWSVVGFVVIGNLVNYYRHRRYVRLIRDHRIEVHEGRIEFWTGGAKTELAMDDVAGVFLYRRGRGLGHLQIRLKSNRGIRLEGYGDLQNLADAITRQLPKAHVSEQRA